VYLLKKSFLTSDMQQWFFCLFCSSHVLSWNLILWGKFGLQNINAVAG
jgi:hypothetical protein